MDCDFIDEEFVYGKNIEKIKRKKEIILDSLKNVIDPDLKKNIVELHFVRNLQIVEKDNKKCDVNFNLNLTTPACPVKDVLIEECKKNVSVFDWVESINIQETFSSFDKEDNDYSNNSKDGKKRNYNKIENIVLIYSCKGGVGKSFFSVNFSFYLKKKGASVGILDADINGPSLSTLLPFDFEYAKFEQVNEEVYNQTKEKHKKEKIFYENGQNSDIRKDNDSFKKNILKSNNNETVFFNNENGMYANEKKGESLIKPLIFKDVKLMSYSYIKNKNDLGFAPFRGAILNELINEFINNVNWGELNYLIIDMPPGTSDMHLSLMEENNNISGAIIITTPNELAINDVQKSINMCNYFNIPIISLIINMSYFICDNCEKKHYIFNSANTSEHVQEAKYSNSTKHVHIGKDKKTKNQSSNSNSSSSSSNSSSSTSNNSNNEDNRDNANNTDILKKLKNQVSKVHEIPFHPIFAKNVYYVNGEIKFPFTLAYNDHFLTKHLERIFEDIVREISILKNNDKFVLPTLQIYKKHFMQLSFDAVKNQFVFSEDILISHIKNIRIHCRCDICKLKKKKLRNKNFLWDSSIYVKEIKPLGIYNVKILWSDNHISVFSYSYLKYLFLKTDKHSRKKGSSLCYDSTQRNYDW